MSRRRVGLAATALLAATLTGAGAIGAVGPGRRAASGFTLAGHVDGLYPGVRKRLVIVVRNRGRRTLVVRSITTRVRDASRGCRGNNLHVARFRGRLRLPGHGSRRIAVSAWLRPETPQACQGAVFRLAFRGRATRG